MRYMLDTSICLALLKGESQAVLDRIEALEPGEVGISAIVVAELAVGAARVDATAILDAFLALFDVVDFDRAAADRYGALPFARGNFDRLIAAHALALDLTLVTANEKDFGIPGLRIENWTRP